MPRAYALSSNVVGEHECVSDCCDIFRPPVEPAKIPAVQRAAAQAVRPVPAEVSVHCGLPAGSVLPGERQERVPAAQGIDNAARRPAVRPHRRRIPFAAVVQATAATSVLTL